MIKSIIDTLLPHNCQGCGTRLVAGEKMLCLNCRTQLDVTGLHLSTDNRLLQRLTQLDLPLEKATAMMYYRRKSMVAALLRRGKYNNAPYIIEQLATEYAHELCDSGYLTGIDLLVPVPMHPFKQFLRGYNQAQLITTAVSRVSGIPTAHHLAMKQWHWTQTRLSSRRRADNTRQSILAVDTDSLTGRHVMVVDDIITTGATILECCRALLQSEPRMKLSVMALGTAQLD